MSQQLIGNLPYYYGGAGEDLSTYIEQLEQYCEINEIDAVKKKSLLLTTSSGELHKTLRDICHPELIKNKTYDELYELIKKQYLITNSVYRERYNFYNAKQSENETVSDWFARIKKLSLECKFGNKYEEILVPRFISGLQPSPIVDRLCEEQDPLTLQRAVEIAESKEMSMKGATTN